MKKYFTALCALAIALLLTVPAAAEADLSVLTADEEKALIKQLAQYPAVVQLAARDYDPSFINRYLVELAAAFHKFFTCRRTVGRPRPRPGRQPGPPSGRQEWCSVSA